MMLLKKKYKTCTGCVKSQKNSLLWSYARFAVILFVVSANYSFAQPFTRVIESIPVLIYGDTIKQPFAGGIDGPNHRFVDIDGDGDLDLYIFDSDLNVDFYRNEGTPQYPNFKLRRGMFPLPVFNGWFIFLDLNGDDKIDLLTDNLSNGVNYYRNAGTRQIPDFQPEATPLLDTAGNKIVSGFLGMPAFADLDGDEDFDFFASNISGTITSYENIGTKFAPSFRYSDGCFQSIIIVNDSCKKECALGSVFKGLHHGGSILAFADMNNDHAQDLLIGDLNSHGMFFVTNNGFPALPFLECSGTHYPPDGSLNTSGYNEPTLADIDNDGDLDLFVAGFVNMGPSNMQRHAFWFYENTGNAVNADFALRTKDYLSVLDVGRNAHPVFEDVNHDGKLDLIIGTVNSQLWYFRNDGTLTAPSFTMVDSVFAGITGNYSYAPAFVDLNGDHNNDLVLGQFDGKIRIFFYNNGYQSSPSESLYTNRANESTVPTFGDLDGDGDHDMLVGKGNGKLHYYRNDGDSINFNPILVTQFYDSLFFGEDAIPLLKDYDNDGDVDLFVGNFNGTLYYYENTGSKDTAIFTMRTDHFADIDPLKESSPALVDIDNDGDWDLFMGTSKGGLQFYRNDAPLSVYDEQQTPEKYLLLDVYPNPFNPTTTIRYHIPATAVIETHRNASLNGNASQNGNASLNANSNASLNTNGNTSLRIYNTLGQEIATLVNEVQSPGEYSVTWDASRMPSGVYLVSLSAGGLTQTKKLLLMK